jgi:nucleotide-binding universal stress UspA family protein
MNHLHEPSDTNATMTVTVALAFDSQAKSLLKSAVNFCRTTKSKLRAVHVCEAFGYMQAAAVSYAPLGDFSVALEGEINRKAESNLKELVEPYRNDVAIETKVLVGTVSEQILQDAKHSGTRLLIVAAPAALKSFVPTGFSTALTIMANAEVPVLSVPFGREVPFDKLDATLIVCDDLSPNNDGLLAVSADFAAALSMNMMHIHVNGLEKDQLEAAVKYAAAAGHTPNEVQVTADDLNKAYVKAIQMRMEERLGRGRNKIEDSGGTYGRSVLSGQLDMALEEYFYKRRNSEEIIAFGRHKTIYQKPFAFGRLPFRAMLKHDVPILIVPPAKL